MTQIKRGLRGVTLTETRLSTIDGEAGKLIIAGFSVEDLAPQASFGEVFYLLLHDRLPNETDLAALHTEMAARRELPELTLTVLERAAARELPPMDALRLGIDTLSLVDEPGAGSREANTRRAVALVARAPTVLAAYARLREGKAPVAPDPELPQVANFLYMRNGEAPDPAAVRALETYFNTVIDHGMNNSTFVARVIASTRSDMTSAVVGAIGALKGPLHGGAPGPAIDMVFEIQRRAQASGRPVAEAAEAWAREALGRGERLMGFGHRVYRVRDPRAEVLGAAAERLFRGTGDTGLYDDARAAERVMLRVLKEHRPARRLQTNVEFYTALVLHGVGLESEVFSAVFALSRLAGWTAHILEQLGEDELIRPSSGYNGARGRVWAPVEAR